MLKKLSLLGFFLLLVGCFQPVTLPEMQSYTLSPSMSQIPRAPSNHKTLLVSPTQAAPAINTTRIAYVMDNYQMNYYTHSQWIAPPAKQISLLIVSALQQSGRYKAVVTPPFSGNADLRLDTRLLHMEQIFSGHESKVFLALSAQLINANSGAVLAEKTFTVQTPVLQNHPYAVVTAANQALAILLRQLTKFLIAH